MTDLLTDSFFANKYCCGIYNIGSTCYISAALQSLAHCMQFSSYILKADTNDSLPVTRSLQELFKTIWNNRIAHPHKLIKALEPLLNGSFNMNQQNDAMEFLMLLFDILNNETGKTIESQTPDPKLKGKARLQNFMDCQWANSFKLAYSYISETFYGQNVIQVKCNLCGSIEHHNETFCILSIDNPSDLESTRIHTCLASYFTIDSISRQCDTCKLGNVLAQKCTRIWRQPKTLVLHIKRFTAQNTKLNFAIDVPTELDLDRYALLVGSTKYQLKSVVCHAGGTQLGHYYSLVKNPNDLKCYFMDDDANPNEVDLKNCNSQNFYILFYELI